MHLETRADGQGTLADGQGTLAGRQGTPSPYLPSTMTHVHTPTLLHSQTPNRPHPSISITNSSFSWSGTFTPRSIRLRFHSFVSSGRIV